MKTNKLFLLFSVAFSASIVIANVSFAEGSNTTLHSDTEIHAGNDGHDGTQSPESFNAMGKSTVTKGDTKETSTKEAANKRTEPEVSKDKNVQTKPEDSKEAESHSTVHLEQP